MASEEGPPVEGISAVSRSGASFPEPEPFRPEPRPRPTPEADPEARRQELANTIADAEGLSRGRLVIEKNPVGQGFIYAIVDPKSGEVMRRWPDSEWAALARRHGMSQGLILDRKA
ncbi:hypothetical protein GC169_08390 [bacterium]|nr:hypothetical protein [bacterium]